MRIAIEKATNAAYLAVSPVKLGCGSWECRCNNPHSVPFKVRGRGGSVEIEIIPGPRGLGLVAGGNIRNLLKLAGLKDVWTKSKLDKIKHYVSWQEIDVPTTKELLEKKARKEGYKKLTTEDIAKLGFKSTDDLAQSLVEGTATLSKLKTVKPWFALSPPRGG